ncbi:hypothetical protein ANN_01280 [Periplaneta americana]|uniref:Uncharacterized protein n=1 Tax=Periplaneta americana TaxID=6978 RepID=A0ABQ8TT44_PERAM|nr:hypothetical protein ANN_01280 [Periplaneta americana]
MDLREVGYDGRDWINLAQNRDRCEGGNEPPGSLKTISKFPGCSDVESGAARRRTFDPMDMLSFVVGGSAMHRGLSTRLMYSRTHRHDTTVHDIIRLLIPALYKNQSDSLMAADGYCHHLCKLMEPGDNAVTSVTSLKFGTPRNDAEKETDEKEEKKLAGSLVGEKLASEGCTGRNGEREKSSGQKKISDDIRH